MLSPQTVPLLLGGLFVWGLFRRVRRNIGRQKLRPRRIIVSITVLALASVLLAVVSLRNLKLLSGLGGGLLLGAPLGLLGLRLTRFETNEQGHFYTPNTHIGIALSLLFAGRLIYRFWILNNSADLGNHPPAMQSALTLLIYGLTAGYYLVYYIGLFVHTHDKQPVP